MGMILVFGIIIAAIGLFAVLSQSGDQQKALAVPSLAGGMLILAAFFALPWVQLDRFRSGLLNMVSDTAIPSDLLEQIGDPEIVTQIQDLLKIATDTTITGWFMVNNIPILGESLQGVFYFGLSAGLMAIAGGIFALTGNPASKIVGAVQMSWCLLAAIMLFLSIGRIRAFGIDPGFMAPVLNIIGLNVGMGVWATLLGLLAGAAGGGLQWATSAVSTHKPPKRRVTLPGPARSRRR